MKDLILSESNSTEENILAIIEFVKQVEREHGLSDDEIVYKYTFGLCWQLANFISRTLKFLFGIKDIKEIYRIGNMEYIDHHVYVQYRDRKLNRCFYFDILGKKTEREVSSFMQSNFWEELDSKGIRKSNSDKLFWETDYVDKACLEHIFAEKSASVNL